MLFQLLSLFIFLLIFPPLFSPLILPLLLILLLLLVLLLPLPLLLIHHHHPPPHHLLLLLLLVFVVDVVIVAGVRLKIKTVVSTYPFPSLPFPCLGVVVTRPMCVSSLVSRTRHQCSGHPGPHRDQLVRVGLMYYHFICQRTLTMLIKVTAQLPQVVG